MNDDAVVPTSNLMMAAVEGVNDVALAERMTGNGFDWRMVGLRGDMYN